MSRGKIELATIFVLFAVIIFMPSGLTPNPSVSAAPNSPYEGPGGLLDVYEFARNDSSTTFRNGVEDTAFTYLGSWFPQTPTVYRGYQLHTEVTNLYEVRDPVPNGEFNQTEPGTAWDESLNSRNLVWGWGTTSSEGNPPDCLDIILTYQWQDKAAEAHYDNTFTYTSDKQPYNSTLEFDIKYHSMITKKKELQVKVALIYHTTEIGSWSETTDVYHPTYWDHLSFSTAPINGSVTLRISIIYSGGKNNLLQGLIYFDNFRYRILTQRSPTEVALTLNNTAIVNTGNNNGEVDVYADPANKDEAALINCWSATQVFQFNSSCNLNFHYHYSMYVKTEKPEAASTYFTAPVDANPTWEVSYTTPSSLPPFGHLGYTFGLFLQTGWALSSVENDTGDVISAYQFNSSSRFIKIDEGIAGANEDFSIFASSSNYVESIHPQISTTGTGEWTNLSDDDYYVKGNYVRVMAKIHTLDVVTNFANISIFYPNQSLWQSDVTPTFFLSNDTLVSTAWLIPSLDNASAGSDWLISVSYHSSNQCGMREKSIAIVIETTATKVTPSDGARVISGTTVIVEVQWKNLDTSDYITDAIARIRYYDRNMQLQTVGMTADGLGGYFTDFSTSLMRPSTTATFSVEIFRYGYVNASYDESSQIDFTINLVNNINYVMVKPTQETSPDVYTAETSKSQGYTSLVKFYDPFQSAYVLNETSLWPIVLVHYDYYEDTGSGFGSPLAYGSFSQNTSTRLFYKEDASFGDVQRVKYVVTMRIIGASWEFEQQNFTIIINVVSWATDLDAVRTTIAYPPTGTGDGWSEYNNVTDSYEVHVYWNETFNINVYYENISALPTHGIASATVNILIGVSVYPLTDLGSGYYSYSVDTHTFSVGMIELYVNATYTDHAAQTIRIQVYIDARATQLTSSYSPTTAQFPYGGSFSVTFTFTDEVSTSDQIDWATPYVLDYSLGKYSIDNHLNGSYTVTFNGDVTEKTYFVTILFNESNYATKSKYYELTVRPIHTATWATTDNPSVPWGTAIVITLKYNDTDNGYEGVAGAFVAFSWMDNETGIDYWFDDNGDGTYTIILYTSKVPAGTQGYTVSFTLSKTHYDLGQIDVSFQVRDIQTTLFIIDTKVMGQTTTSVPWGETLTLILHYNDTENGVQIPAASISCNWAPLDWSVIYNVTDHAYYLTIYTDNEIEGGYTIQIFSSKSHYSNGYNIQSFVIREIQTALTADRLYVPSLAWGDNLTIELTYQDLDHGGALIPYATTTTDWNAGFFTFYDLGNGSYLLALNTTCRTIGQYSILITFSDSPISPHFATRSLNVLVKLDPIPILVSVISPPGGQNSTKYNDAQILTVNVTDHLGRPVNDATVVYEWAGRNNVTMAFLGNGIYTYTFLANADPGSWIVTIIASNPPNYREGSSFIVLVITPTETKLETITPYPVIAVANTSFIFTVNFTTLNDQPITGANVTFLFGPYNGLFSAISPGIYEVSINTGSMSAGQYTLYISASKANMQTQWREIPVSLTRIPCRLQVDAPVQNVDWGDNFTVYVYFNDTFNNSPITGANITYNWSTLAGSLEPNGTLGWYTISLSSTVYLADSYYYLLLTADYSGYEYAFTSININIRPQSTDLILIRTESYYPPDGITTQLNGTNWRIPWGDLLILYFNYTDSAGAPILNATGVYNWGYGTGNLEFHAGLYIAYIDLTGVSQDQYSLSISLSRQNYEPQYSSSYVLDVTRITVSVVILESPPVVSTGAPFDITIQLFDSYHGLPVSDAQVTAQIPGLGSFELINNQDGTFTLAGISLPAEQLYLITFEATGHIRYDFISGQTQIVAQLSPIIRQYIQIGALVAVIGIILLAIWFAYARVFSVPWMVRKMRKMSHTISKGQTPTISKGDLAHISSRPSLMQDLASPAYQSLGLAIGTVMLPTEVDLREKEAEDDAIWSELKSLPFIEYEQKLELFQQMKQIAPAERVWFIEDLRKQMGDGTRFGRKVKEPEISKDVETELQARLATYPTLSKLEKERIAAQLRKIPKEDWEEVFQTLAIADKPQAETVEEVLGPAEFPSLTEKERQKLLDELKDLSDEERQKVLQTFREKRSRDVPKGKIVKDKKEFIIDDSDDK